MIISQKDLITFYKKNQGEVLKPERAMDIIYRYGFRGKFRVADFVHFIHGNENELWNPLRKSTIYDDMTLPLTEYFMNSSHNTYLMGDQFRSNSSVEAYISPLLSGCRCVEIDTWDGKDGDPVVYHGHTLTSKIKYRDVIPVRKAIARTSHWCVLSRRLMK